MRVCLIPRCDKPAHHDLDVCLGCCADLERHLGDVAALAAELDLTISRQTASGGNGGTRSTTRPLAYDTRASDAAARLRNALVTWVRAIAPDEAATGPTCRGCVHSSCSWVRRGTWPTDTPAAMAAWLLTRIEILRTHGAVVQICGDFDGACHAAWRAIDRHPDLQYAGPCSIPTATGPCPEHLYAKPGAIRVTCRGCGWDHDVAARREFMLADLQDKLLTAAEIIKAAHHLKVIDSSARAGKLIDTWARRGRITARGVNLKGRPTYRFGEVRDLFEGLATRRAEPDSGSLTSAS